MRTPTLETEFSWKRRALHLSIILYSSNYIFPLCMLDSQTTSDPPRACAHHSEALKHSEAFPFIMFGSGLNQTPPFCNFSWLIHQGLGRPLYMADVLFCLVGHKICRPDVGNSFGGSYFLFFTMFILGSSYAWFPYGFHMVGLLGIMKA